MATLRRRERVNHLLQAEIGRLLEFEIEDPRLHGLTVSAVEISTDLRHARVFIVGFTEPAREKEARAGLEHAKPYLRRALARTIQLRVVPDLEFAFDHSIERGSRIEALLRAAQDKTEPE